MTELEPRWYQSEAITATWDYMQRHKDNPCIVIPTAGGKSPTMAMMIREVLTEWDDTRVCVLAHVKELIEQNIDKAMAWWPDAPLGTFGVYSAGLGARDTRARAVFAGIHSAHKNPLALGRFDLIFVDEAHRITESDAGMYREFLRRHKEANPALRVVGFTATPYRMTTGSIIGPDNILNAVSFEVGVRDLIDQKYLSKLTSKRAVAQADTSQLHIRGGEYIKEELESVMTADGLVERAVKEIIHLGQDRRAWLLFAASVAHGQEVTDALLRSGIRADIVTGKTKAEDRDRIIQDFQSGELQALVNVMVLTEGFDAPHIDLIALLRPTKSPGLYYQMVGRGLRKSPGKEDCLVLDFAGIIADLGPIDDLHIRPRGNGGGSSERTDPSAPTLKDCPQCQVYVPAGVEFCPECGYHWPPKHTDIASDESVIAEKKPPEIYEIESAEYDYHTPKQEGKTPTLKATYYGTFGQRICSQWLCFEHPPGFARRKAEDWFNLHVSSPWISQDIPMTIVEVLELINDLRDSGEWKPPNRITVDENGKFPEVKKLEFPENMPTPDPIPILDGDPGDDVPF